MSKIKEAFDNLINTISAEAMEKFDDLDKKIKEARLSQLQKDLDELNKRAKN